MPEQSKTRLLRDWMDALSDFTLEEVQAAIRHLLRDNPKGATNEEQVKRIVQQNRAARLAAIPKAPEPSAPINRVTADRAAQIVAEAGFAMRVAK